MRNLTGTLLVILAAICFGFMGLFASWAMADGVSVEMLLFLRFLMAGVVMLALARVRRVRLPSRRVLMGLIGMGAALYVGESLLFFHAMRHIPVALVSLLLYMYPVVVTLIAWLVLRERMNLAKSVALGLAIAGLTLTILPTVISDRAVIEAPGVTPSLGVALGIGCCLSYSIYILAGGPLTRRAGAIAASTIVIVSAALAFGVIVLLRGDAWPSTQQAWLGAASLAIVGTVIPIGSVLAGLERVGPVQTSTLSTLEPVVTALVGTVLMSQPITLVQAVGGVLIVAAAVLVANSGRVAARAATPSSADVYEMH